MVYCRKCGAQMAPTDTICSVCGTMVGDWSDDRNELIGKLEKYKELLSETEELKQMIKPQSSFPSSDESNYKKRSFIKYFWPYMVCGIVGGYLVYFVSSLIVAMNSRSMMIKDSGRAAATLMGDTLAGVIIALLVAAAVIFFGVKIAKRKQEDFNRNAEYMNMEAAERYQKGVNNQKMINLYQEDINNMRRYELLVPEEYRTSVQVGKIIDLLKEDKASTVEEACSLIA